MPVKVQVKQTGRIQKPKLDYGVLTYIGKRMVDRQKKRWSQATNADGAGAKKLSKKYFFIKRRATKNTRPKRDMVLTGATKANFLLRKAINGVIRAENTTRKEREKAKGANRIDQMIGFAGEEVVGAFADFKDAYGKWCKSAWVKFRA